MKKKAIAIFAAPVRDLPVWGPDDIKKGIPGSEEAVIYMSKELADLGYEVTVFGDPPKYSPYSVPSSNPKYIQRNFYSPSVFDFAISCRMPSVGCRLKTMSSKVYLWPQDILNEMLTEKQVRSFEDVFWISKWQRKQWVSVNPGFEKFTGIYGNGINLNQFYPIEERENPYSCIYGSNYSRGLEILLDIWPEIKQRFPKASLDIYYGWTHWGTLSPEKEAKMRAQIPALAELDVRHHGQVGHLELNQAYAKASLWTYPCLAPETFCITAMRAQCSGAIPVIIEGSALGETVKSGYVCMRPENYLFTLIHAMKEVEKFPLKKRQEMREFVSNQYTWKTMAYKFHQKFESQ